MSEKVFVDNAFAGTKKRITPILLNSKQEEKSQIEKIFNAVKSNRSTKLIDRGSMLRVVYAIQNDSMNVFKEENPRIASEIVKLSKLCVQVGYVDFSIVNIENLTTLEAHSSLIGDPAQVWHVDADGDERYLTAIIPVDEETFGTEFKDNVPGKSTDEQAFSSDGGWNVSTTEGVIFNGNIVHRGPAQLNLPNRRFIAAVFTEKKDVNN